MSLLAPPEQRRPLAPRFRAAAKAPVAPTIEAVDAAVERQTSFAGRLRAIKTLRVFAVFARSPRRHSLVDVVCPADSTYVLGVDLRARQYGEVVSVTVISTDNALEFTFDKARAKAAQSGVPVAATGSVTRTIAPPWIWIRNPASTLSHSVVEIISW